MYRRIPQFMGTLLVLQSLLLYLHWFVYQTIIVLLNIENPSVILRFKILFVVLSLSFMSSSMLVWRHNNALIRTFYRFTMGWMGFFFYFFMASFFSWVAFDLTSDLNAKIVMIVLFAVAALVAILGIKNANKIRVTPLTVALPNLPAAWKKKTAVFLSDTHLGQIRGEQFAKRVVEKIQSLKPDIVFMSGDAYDGVEVDIARVTEPFSRLVPPLGVWFVTGNHDEFRNTEQHLAALKSAGFNILMNAAAEIEGVQIVGVDYATTELKKEYREILQKIKIDPEKPSILLRHVPNFLKVAEEAGISLELSGHTHYGQVFPLTILTSWIFGGYGYGFKKKGNMGVYTSSGVGTWGPPLRVGTKSEIVEIKFE